MIERVWDWEVRLVDYIAQRQSRPFEFGKRANDCCSFANGAVVAMTDFDAMADIPDYASAEEADLILEATLESLMDARFERHEAPAFARRGDIGITDMLNLDTLVVVENEFVVGPGRRRLQRVPRHLMRVAWRVG